MMATDRRNVSLAVRPARGHPASDDAHRLWQKAIAELAGLALDLAVEGDVAALLVATRQRDFVSGIGGQVLGRAPVPGCDRQRCLGAREKAARIEDMNLEDAAIELAATPFGPIETIDGDKNGIGLDLAALLADPDVHGDRPGEQDGARRSDRKGD